MPTEILARLQLNQPSPEYEFGRRTEPISCKKTEPMSWKNFDLATWKILDRVRMMEPEDSTAKDLQDAAGLSRSAALKRCHELSDEGILVKRIKPGTENRSYPPYIFSMSPDVREEVIAFLESDIVQERLLKEKSITDDTNNLQELNQSEPAKTDLQQDSESAENQASLSTEAFLKKPADNSHSLSKSLETHHDEDTQHDIVNLSSILKKMAQEIARLKERVNQLEQRAEESSLLQTDENTDLKSVLKILENPQHKKEKQNYIEREKH